MDTLCHIRDIQRAIIAYEQKLIREHELTLNEAMLLCSLSRSEQLASGEIAELLGLTCSNTSKVISSVEKKRLIRRLLGKKDKRQMYFSLTKEGWQRLETIRSKEVALPDELSRLLEFFEQKEPYQTSY
jgi:DNA-binding MarR family transcriptional regulator